MKYYPVNYCLDGESDFEDYHPLFDKKANTLLLTVTDIEQLIGRCEKETDNVGISFGGEVTGKWDALEVHGVDGKFYTLEFQIGSLGGSYLKKSVPRPEVLDAINSLPKNESDFDGAEFDFVGW